MGVTEIIIAVAAVCLVAFTIVFNIVRRKKGGCGCSVASCDSCSKSCSHKNNNMNDGKSNNNNNNDDKDIKE